MSDVIQNQSHPLDGTGPVVIDAPGFSMRPKEDCARFSLRIPGPHLQEASKAFGAPIPGEIGVMSPSGQKTALCLGPDEWLLLAPETDHEAIANRFAELSQHHSLVDIGHRNVALDITGSAAASVINAGCPLDLEKLPMGHGTRTVLDKAQIILIKPGNEHYQLEVARSFAEYIWMFLSSAARELNAEINP